MKRFFLLVLGVALFASLGCGHVETTVGSDPNRVVTGTVNVRMNLIPPPDAEIVVRIVEPPDVTSAPAAASKDLVIGERGTRERPEQLVGEQIIRAPGALPLPFRIEFRADDGMLRHGLNVEARISWGGRLRFRTIESQVITLRSIERAEPIAIWVEPVR